MSNDEQNEIIEALEVKEGKKLKPITLPDNSNVIDTGTTQSTLELEIKRLKKEIDDMKWQALQEEQRRIPFDPYYQQKYMQRMTAIRDEQQQRHYAQLAESQARQREASEAAAKERLAKNENYQKAVAKIEKEKEKEIRNLEAYWLAVQTNTSKLQ
jgi:regulator of protease activity HflC (stomatin/prohibitin superfamily)